MPDNNTPAIKITSSSVSLEAMFVARFVAAAFDVVADTFLLLQQVAQQKSATKVYVCHQSNSCSRYVSKYNSLVQGSDLHTGATVHLWGPRYTLRAHGTSKSPIPRYA